MFAFSILTKKRLTGDHMVTYTFPMTHEQVFKALADESRRKLLDLLYLEDGQSLSQLGSQLPMTRFGVMKHLRILKEAGLIATRKSGRETLHYLNAVPIQMVYDRWVSKYSRGWARSLTELKYDIEENGGKDNDRDTNH
jgi:DNA-binding transcriptional ArsR family regulator